MDLASDKKAKGLCEGLTGGIYQKKRCNLECSKGLSQGLCFTIRMQLLRGMFVDMRSA